MNPWNLLISTLPDPHLLQTYEWGMVKSKYGWSPLYAVWDGTGGFAVSSQVPAVSSAAAAALLLKKTVLNRGFAARLSILYAPKGPLLDWSDTPLRMRVLADLEELASRQGAVFLKMDPDLVLGTGIPGEQDETPDETGMAVTAALSHRGWRISDDQIQFRNTVLIDLRPPEMQILERMKQKTRYNVRLAEKKGVVVRTGKIEDFPLLFRMYAETSVRDGFVIRDEQYYQTVWHTFMKAESPHCEPLIAEVDGEPVAAIFLFFFAGRAYYLYGMSRLAHREKMPSYLLQWEAIRRAKAVGCETYDLWGAPDQFNAGDGMWGVYRFKEGLGGRVVRTAGAWDYAPNKMWYGIYTQVMPRMLDIMRSRGRRQVRRSLE
jgi:lipid II:glycine glycyltransferase (peptidoglycan interpeptide bridge formation enzyme)